MTNDHIQSFLSLLSTQGLTTLERQAYEFVAWLAGVNGPMAIADQAAWEIVTCECIADDLDGHLWWNTHPQSMQLDLEDRDSDIEAEVHRALTYLSTRGVLLTHPTYHTLVRWPEQAPSGTDE